MKISKRIPSRTKTVKFNWAYTHFLQCTQRYIDIRKYLRGKRSSSMISCDWCRRKFDVDEWFVLAKPLPGQEGPSRKWTLCHECAESMGAGPTTGQQTLQSHYTGRNRAGYSSTAWAICSIILLRIVELKESSTSRQNASNTHL